MRLAFLVMALLSVHVMAGTKLYKTVDDNGNVVFSDSAPAGAEVQEIEIREQDTNVVPSGTSRESNQKQQVEKVDREQKYSQAMAKWEADYAQAQIELKAAEAANADAQEIREGDMVGTVFGGAKPSEGWNDRRAKAEGELAVAQDRLRQLKKQKPRLYAQ